MICFETQYFSNTKILLRGVGLWPYQQSRYVRLQFMLFWGILMTAIIFQLTSFITSQYTLNFIIKILSTILFCIILITKYTAFHVHMDTVKDLLTQFQNVCNGLKEEYEIAVIEKYGCNAKCYTTILTMLIIFCIPITIIGQLWPCILDIVQPKNVSRPRHLQFMMEYFIDQEKYFYFILFHLDAAIIIGSTAFVATGTTIIAVFHFFCGMFMIASYRIENIVTVDILQDINWKNENFMLKKIIHAVDMHRQAIKLCDYLVGRLNNMFSFLIVFQVSCLSLNLFQTIFSGDIEELVLSIMLANALIIYMFIANYCAQKVMDHDNQIYVAAYNFQWYKAPLSIQKLILFVLQKGMKNFTVTIGGLFVGSLESFALLIQLSISYFAVIYSTR